MDLRRQSPNPLIDLRTFAHTRAGAAAGTFLLFAISVFGTLLLVPLYYQAVRGASALQAGLLLAPGGLGAMLMMPLAGRLTDRYGPTWPPATGLPLVAIELIRSRLSAPTRPTCCFPAPTLSRASGWDCR